MTKKQKILSALAAVAVPILGYFLYEHFMYVKTDNAQIQAHSLMLASKVPGFVVKVNAEEGQKVKKGDILVEIDPRDFQNTLLQAKSELLSLQAKKLDAERNAKRLMTLFSGGAVSQQQHDTSLAASNEIRAKYDAISAQVAQAELNLENTKIKAPMDGYIAKKSVEQGQLASPGVPLIGFVNAEERWVTANFKETEIASIRIGSAVDVAVDAYSGRELHGKVDSISAATGATFALLPPDNATGNFTKVVQRVPVKIKLENLNETEIDSLRAGLSAEVKVHKH